MVRTGLAEKKDPSTDFQGRGTEPRGCHWGGGEGVCSRPRESKGPNAQDTCWVQGQAWRPCNQKGVRQGKQERGLEGRRVQMGHEGLGQYFEFYCEKTRAMARFQAEERREMTSFRMLTRAAVLEIG